MKNKRTLICLIFIVILWSCQEQKLSSSSLKSPFFIWGFAMHGFPISKNMLEQLEQETKISAQVIQFYLQWPASLEHFESIRSTLDSIADQGSVPSISWEPMFVVKGVETMIPYEKILKGEYDPYLAHIANEIKTWNKPLIIRFAHEMNLKRYHWGTTKEQFNQDSPNQYIQMFRYVVNYFKNQNVNQVFWTFCPNVDSDPDQPWNTPRHYYPGDDYVDILGMDGYNWNISEKLADHKKQSWNKPYASFEQIFHKLYQELKSLAPHKPVMVFETASVDRDKKQKCMWIKEAIQTAKTWGLTGIIWFQVNKEEDWRMNQNDDYAYAPIVRSASNPLQEGLHNVIHHPFLPECEKK